MLKKFVNCCFQKGRTVRLMKRSDVEVEASKFRHILTSCHRKGGPFTLFYKLLPLAFTSQELASSSGLGQRSDKATKGAAGLDEATLNACKGRSELGAIPEKNVAPQEGKIN